ncbi:MAG: YceI family protein [Actinomycetota bacterium]|jgi:polyisoprenoid-binding protein YceI|nr:YceI family protein [Actinomycetota bacterium]
MSEQTTAVKLPTPGTYTVDPAHSEVGFVARHLIGSKVRGRFTKFEGTIVIADPIEHSSVEAQAETASIETGVQMRDDHMRTNDFLDASNFPTLSLESTGLTKVTDTEWKLAADLTIRGVTKSVVFDVEYHGSGPGTQPGSEVLALSASTEIDRRDFGVSFSGVLEGGAIVVGNRVRIELEVEAGRQG